MTPTPLVPVLMYHATPSASDPGDTNHDAHYTVPIERFERQIAIIRAAGATPRDVLQVASQGGCAVTFDDGDGTNAAAAEVLVRYGGTADFFINSSTVGTGRFLNWPTIRKMVQLGMSIQSHGHTHRYFDMLSPAEIREELAESKLWIEQETSRPVVLFAPPGGRQRPEIADIAAELGYIGICTSRAGAWTLRTGLGDVPRLAVLASTSDERFERWIRADEGEMRRMRWRKMMLDLGKRTLGNRAYDSIRARLVGGIDRT